MIDVDYNEYKETLAENMKLIRENHDLKERLSIYESDSDTVIMVKEKWEETKKEIERLNNIINELEKALDENVELTYVHNEKRQYNKTLTEGGLLFRDYIKSKLQELKGSESNE